MNTDLFFIFGAVYVIYIMIILTFLLGLKGKPDEKKAFLIILVALPITFLLIKIIHIFFLEPRPFMAGNITPLVNEVADASFPSRHAAISAVIAFSFAYFKSKWSFLFLTLMLWIGVSRVYVGVHFWWDILGGFAVAGLALFLAVIFVRYFRTHLLS